MMVLISICECRASGLCFCCSLYKSCYFILADDDTLKNIVFAVLTTHLLINAHQMCVMDYIPNTIILYFIVHCIYVLCLFYCITCLHLSLAPPVSGLRFIVFNKVMLCSVMFCSVNTKLHSQKISMCTAIRSHGLQMNENPCSSHEIHILFEHGFKLDKLL